MIMEILIDTISLIFFISGRTNLTNSIALFQPKFAECPKQTTQNWLISPKSTPVGVLSSLGRLFEMYFAVKCSADSNMKLHLRSDK